LVHHCKRSGIETRGHLPSRHLSWSGFQEYARAWLLLGRRERYAPGSGLHRLWLSMGGSAGHSMLFALDVNEGTSNGGALRTWDVRLRAASDAREEAAEERQRERDQQHLAKVETLTERILEALATGPDTKRGIRERVGSKGNHLMKRLRHLCNLIGLSSQSLNVRTARSTPA
jgi:hypothetical protein